jgi:hypothetical protein
MDLFKRESGGVEGGNDFWYFHIIKDRFVNGLIKALFNNH